MNNEPNYGLTSFLQTFPNIQKKPIQESVPLTAGAHVGQNLSQCRPPTLQRELTIATLPMERFRINIKGARMVHIRAVRHKPPHRTTEEIL